ncbi:OmpW family outer membrane protein, partial [Wenyingzhuangia sp. 1_MG-2023]|nr:OmpW family outer membrane protein [Wenyingzhuangia sp. 1_MG-2023]
MKLIKTLLATVVAVSAIPAMAYEAGDIIVKAGAVTVSPKDGNADSSGLVAGSELDVLSDTQMGLTGVYMVTSQI